MSTNPLAIRFRVPVFLECVFLLANYYGFAESCQSPTAERQSELASYVRKHYHLDPSGQLTLVESVQANASCFWRLHYTSSAPKSEFTLYLSPDGQFLAPTLLDTSIDPVVEERTRATQAAKAMLAGDPPSTGPVNAPITIVEFSDFQCPFCKRFADTLEKELAPDERKGLRIVFREFPLPMHPWARQAAEVAGCAALQSDAAFWKVHDYLFSNQKSITMENLLSGVMSIPTTGGDLDSAVLKRCVDRKLSTGGVDEDIALGKSNGVKATPTLFINGIRYEGAKDADQLRAVISSEKHSRAGATTESPQMPPAK
jgi:protein-disulfide isomerase